MLDFMRHQQPQQMHCLLNDVLMRFSLPLQNCRGKCYDSASNMSGIKAGFQVRLLEQEPRAQYVHCTAHLVNLVVMSPKASLHVATL